MSRPFSCSAGVKSTVYNVVLSLLILVMPPKVIVIII